MAMRMWRDRHHVAARSSVVIISATAAAASCARRRSPHGLVRVEAHALSSGWRRRHCVVAQPGTQLPRRQCRSVVRTALLGGEPSPVASREVVRGRHCGTTATTAGACAAAIHHHARLDTQRRLRSVQCKKSSRESLRPCGKIAFFLGFTRRLHAPLSLVSSNEAHAQPLHSGSNECARRERRQRGSLCAWRWLLVWPVALV